MKRLLALALFLFAASANAACPTFVPGAILTAAQLNACGADLAAVSAVANSAATQSQLSSVSSAVASLGTMAQQNASAVAITGGTITGVVVSSNFVSNIPSSVARASTSKLNDTVSVYDMGASGDGVADDTNAMAAATSSVDSVQLPLGVYRTSKAKFAYAEPSRLLGDGVIIVSDVPVTTLETNKHSRNIDLQRGIAGSAQLLSWAGNQVANTETFTEAVASGAANVCFVGDSITESAVPQGWPEGTWVRNVMRAFDESFPKVKFNFINQGLAGTNSSHIANTGFMQGDASGLFPAHNIPTTYPMMLGYWPTGSISGVSWQAQVRASNCDILFSGFGMNDGGTLSPAFYANMKSFYDYLQTWVKVPTLVIVTNSLPTRLNPAYLNVQRQLEGDARASRYLAGIYGALLVDQHRVFKFLRDGVDDTVHYFNRESAIVKNFGNTAWWTIPGGVAVPTVAGATLTGTTTWRAQRHVESRDMVAAVQFNVTNVSQAPALYFRVQEGYAIGSQGYLLQWQGTTWALYQAGVLLKNYTGLSAPVVGSNYVYLEVVQSALRLYLNGLKIIDDTVVLTDQTSGNFGLGINAAIVPSSATINYLSFGFPAHIGKPLLDDNDLVGAQPTTAPLGFNNNPDSEGGNNINHPTITGQSLMYTMMIAPAIKRLVDASAYHVLQSIGSTDITNSASSVLTSTMLSASAVGNINDMYDVQLSFPYVNAGTDNGKIGISVNGVAHGGAYGEERYLVPTGASGGTVELHCKLPLSASGSNVFGVYWQAAPSGSSITSNAASDPLYKRVLTVRKS